MFVWGCFVCGILGSLRDGRLPGRRRRSQPPSNTNQPTNDTTSPPKPTHLQIPQGHPVQREVPPGLAPKRAHGGAREQEALHPEGRGVLEQGAKHAEAGGGEEGVDGFGFLVGVGGFGGGGGGELGVMRGDDLFVVCAVSGCVDMCASTPIPHTTKHPQTPQTHRPRRRQREARSRAALHADDALVRLLLWVWLLLRSGAAAALLLFPGVGGDAGLGLFGEGGVAGEEELEGLLVVLCRLVSRWWWDKERGFSVHVRMFTRKQPDGPTCLQLAQPRVELHPLRPVRKHVVHDATRLWYGLCVCVSRWSMYIWVSDGHGINLPIQPASAVPISPSPAC